MSGWVLSRGADSTQHELIGGVGLGMGGGGVNLREPNETVLCTAEGTGDTGRIGGGGGGTGKRSGIRNTPATATSRFEL